MNRIALALAVTAAMMSGRTALAVRVEHASVQERALHGRLADAVAEVSAAGGRWIIWDEPTNEPGATMCCWSSVDVGQRSGWKRGTCRLGEQDGVISNGRAENTPASFGDETFSILLHVESGKAAGVRIFSSDCTVDAGGAPVVRLTGVTPEASVAYLAGIAESFPPATHRKHDEERSAIAAIGMHRASNMIATLASIIDSHADDEKRGQAAFWLGMKGGDEGRAILRRTIDADASSELRHQAIAGIAQDHTRAATDLLLSMARTHPSADVRRQSIFWLGQHAGEKAAAQLKEATDDPNDDVKEMAVFAISQLPRDRAIPELIEIARTNRSRAAREKAVFWLGQSGDPRALDFIESLLVR